MSRLGTLLGITLAAASLAAGAPEGGAGPESGSISDAELGLAKGSVFDVADPDPVIPTAADPGDGAPLPRPFPGAPPRVSHSLTDLLPITRSDNLCIDCHLIAEAGEGEPTPIPESHRVDLRNAPAVVGESVAGARHNCVACHVERTDARPLLGAASRVPPAE